MSVLILRPNSDYSVNLTRSSGDDNYALVDETTLDTNDYVERYSSSWATDLYGMPDHTTESGVITSVTVKAYFGRSGSIGSAYARTVLYVGDTLYEGDAVNMGGGYPPTLHSTTYNTNPYSGSAWTWEDIDNLLAGCSATGTGTGERGRCYQLWVEVVVIDDKSLSDSQEFADAITQKDVSKSLSDSQEFSDDIEYQLEVLQSGLQSLFGMWFAGFAVTGTELTKACEDSLVILDDISKTAKNVCADVQSFSDDVNKKIGKINTDAVSLVDGLAKTFSTTRSDSLSFADELSKVMSFVHLLEDEQIFADGILKHTTKALIDSVNVLDEYSSRIITGLLQLSLQDSVEFNDSHLSLLSKILSDIQSITDSYAKNLGITHQSLLALSDSVQKNSIKNFEELISYNDTCAKNFDRIIADGFSCADSVAKKMGISFADTSEAQDVLATVLIMCRLLDDEIVLIDDQIKNIGIDERDEIAFLDEHLLDLINAQIELSDYFNVVDHLYFGGRVGKAAKDNIIVCEKRERVLLASSRKREIVFEAKTKNVLSKTRIKNITSEKKG